MWRSESRRLVENNADHAVARGTSLLKRSGLAEFVADALSRLVQLAIDPLVHPL